MKKRENITEKGTLNYYLFSKCLSIVGSFMYFFYKIALEFKNIYWLDFVLENVDF